MRFQRVATCGLVMALAACGGGGGGSQPNQPPLFSGASLQIQEDATLTTQLVATDPDGDRLTFEKTSDPTHGSVTVTTTGLITYVPQANYNGNDQFGVRIADPKGAAATGAIAISVQAVNDPPVAQEDELRLAAGTVVVPVLANDTDPDGDALTVTILSQPRGGTVSATNGAVTFAPENAYAGPASFSYRIADPSGRTSEATAKLVVGEFPGIVFASDDTTLGTRELYLYDGFRNVRVSAPLPPGSTVVRFAIAGDANHVAYVAETVAGDRVFLGSLREPGTARLIYASSRDGTSVTLNRDGTYALISDPALSSALMTVLVRTSDAQSTVLGTSNPELGGGGIYAVFNPVTDEFYLQAKVGGTRALATSGYTTLYGASTSAPDPLVRLGATYTPDHGNGSGMIPSVTRDGQRVVHISITFGFPTPSVTPNLLVNHRPSNTETTVYRELLPYEFETPVAFDLSKDSTNVCYILNTPSSSESRIWFSDLTTAGHAVALSPVTTSNFGCKWAADDRTIVYQSQQAPNSASELWLANTAQPGSAQRVREPLVTGEQLRFSAVASRSMTALLGISRPNSVMPDFYRASLTSPGSSTKFATGTFIVSGNQSRPVSNPTGTLIAYGKGDTTAPNPALPRLRLMSTQTTDYDWLVSRPDGTVGVVQFEFLSSL